MWISSRVLFSGNRESWNYSFCFYLKSAYSETLYTFSGLIISGYFISSLASWNLSNLCFWYLQHPSAALFLKSNFEYERGNFRKAIKLLTGAQHDSDPWQTGESVPVMYYNNLGCVHFYMGKYHLACHYAKKALMENTEAVQLLVKKSSK